MKERRRGIRTIAFFRTEVSYRKKSYVGYIVNISVTGCAFAHENLTAIDLGGTVRVKFRLDGKIVNQEAEVRWRDSTLMGLRFLKPSATATKVLRDYIRSVTLRRIPL